MLNALSPMTAVVLLAGLLLLVSGAELLVRGAARLASRLGISPLVIGLTVVAFGTSTPETAVSVQAAIAGRGDLAIGNVLGSNIANVLLILGLAALIAPLRVSHRLIRLDVPIMIAASLAAFALAWDGALSRLEGALLFAAILAYTLFLILQSRKDAGSAAEEFRQSFGSHQAKRHTWLFDLLKVMVGLALLLGGAQLLVEGAVQTARALGLSELVIGLTVVAVGTALPELATSLLAALRGQRDMAVGNLIGSNIFNLLCVMGLSALLSPQPLSVSPNALVFDFPVMIAVAVACLPVFFAGQGINRWEGLLFLAYYGAYVSYLVLFSVGMPQASILAHALLGYALPLTALTLLLLAARAWRRRHH